MTEEELQRQREIVLEVATNPEGHSELEVKLAWFVDQLTTALTLERIDNEALRYSLYEADSVLNVWSAALDAAGEKIQQIQAMAEAGELTGVLQVVARCGPEEVVEKSDGE